MAEGKSSSKQSAPAPSLEAAITRLEEIVAALESGEVDLDQSIDLYAEGRRLGALALQRLEALERRVQVVKQGEEGGLEVEDFEGEARGD